MRSVPPHTIAPSVVLAIRLKRAAEAVEAAAEVIPAPPCPEPQCGSLEICTQLYAGWRITLNGAEFELGVDTLPAAAFELRVEPAGSTSLCPGAAFVFGDPLDVSLVYTPGTDTLDHEADFSFEWLEDVLVVNATGAGDYTGAFLQLFFNATQSVCENVPSGVFSFGPPLEFGFVS